MTCLYFEDRCLSLIRRADPAGDGEDLVLAIQEFEYLYSVGMISKKLEIEGWYLPLFDNGKFLYITQ